MEKLIISEQDIINALCIYISRKKQVKPEEVEVELMRVVNMDFLQSLCRRKKTSVNYSKLDRSNKNVAGRIFKSRSIFRD